MVTKYQTNKLVPSTDRDLCRRKGLLLTPKNKSEFVSFTQTFATKLAGPRINAYFISLSHGLFLTCRGVKYELHKNIFTAYTTNINTCVAIKTKRIHYFGW
jgi:hypothetical protein